MQKLDYPDLAGLFHLETPPALPLRPNYNAAPTQQLYSVAVIDHQRQLTTLRWGLVPSWAKDLSIGNKLINARLETIAEKPSFRHAFRKNRVLIPADGFYEWAVMDGHKQPFFIYYRDRLPVAFAGLAEYWKDPKTGEEIRTCTIITTEANDFMRQYHHRMPAAVDASAYDAWLDPKLTEPADILALLTRYDYSGMAAYPVSARVNSPSQNDALLIHELQLPDSPVQPQLY